MSADCGPNRRQERQRSDAEGAQADKAQDAAPVYCVAAWRLFRRRIVLMLIVARHVNFLTFSFGHRQWSWHRARMQISEWRAASCA
jgi:hypothetical protein